MPNLTASKIPRRLLSNALRRQAIPVALFGSTSSWWHTTSFRTIDPTACERAVAAKRFDTVVSWKNSTAIEKARRVLRLCKRLIRLCFNLFPIFFLYPFVWLFADQPPPREETDAHVIALMESEEVPGILGWYYNLCLGCVESSGAAVIKLCQWAGSRPDMFGHEFCAIFSKLQDDTTPHNFRYTERILDEAFPNWRDRLELHDILGSGCIGQVYRGTAVVDDVHQEVAVKVLHPGIEDDIEADLDLMRIFVRAIKHLPNQFLVDLKWMNMEGIVEEFAGLLNLQLDLRREAANLERFNENFKADAEIQFPKLVPNFQPKERVLVETFCEGIPVIQYCRKYKENQEHLSLLCKRAIQAVCKMIFLHNFVHGDMHPGNIFVSKDGKSFILLDLGIVNEYNDRDHNLIVDILAAFIRKQGRRAGRLMIDDSNVRLSECDPTLHSKDEDEYIDKIEHLTIQASQKGYLMENLGSYITYICEAAATHHVLLNPSFISAALAVKVEEGIALAMDPSVKIPNIAIPIIVESESRRVTTKFKFW